MEESSNMPTKLIPEIITAAILGFEVQKTRINAQIAELRAVLTGGPAAVATTPEAPTRKRKKFSAASRRKMAMAQKARWAASKKAAEPTPTGAPKRKRKLSRAGRAAIIAATKKRWAAVRAAKAS